MNKMWWVALAMAGAFSAAAATWQGTGEISFQVTETMNRKFSGTGTAEPFTAEVTKQGAAELASWTVTVKPGGLSTKKKARDEEMHKMFRLPEFPAATGEVKDFDLASLKTDAGVTNTMPVRMTLIGVSQDLTAKVTNVKREGGGISFDADVLVDMKSFTLKPKVLLGMFKVHNEVPVRVSVKLTP